MKSTCVAQTTAAAATEEYLGFAIREDAHGCLASPKGWAGPDLTADSLPLIRKQIWFWWHLAE